MSSSLHFECQKYEELDGPDKVYWQINEVARKENVINHLDFPSNWLLQLKYDGIWARVVIQNNRYEIFSKTGQLKKTGSLTQSVFGISEPIVLIGEYMFGSQWSTHPERAGRLYIFDCLADGPAGDISRLPYKDRYRAAVSQTLQLGQPFNILPCYSISKLGEFWTSLEGQTEGFVIRRWSDTWDATLFKLKYEVEDDFIITGFKPGKGKYDGTLGSLELSQYAEDGRLQYVMSCSGMADEERHIFWQSTQDFLFKVCLVTGKGRFADGALRHPAFVRIRNDKKPRECLLKRQSR